MAKPELGLKRVCVACGAKFYDLGKTPAICPKCGTEQPADQPRLKRAAGNVAEEKRPKKPVPGADDDEPETEVAEEDGEEDVLESTDDLEDDTDPLGTEIEVEPESDSDDR
jgi:uncharacterized protein (TIGR02300 family)